MKVAILPGAMGTRLAEATQLLAEPWSKADTVRFSGASSRATPSHGLTTSLSAVATSAT